MFKKLSCLIIVFAFVLSSLAEDLQSVMAYYQPDMSKGFIYVSKVDMTLTLVNSQGKVIKAYPMACGRNRGQKQRQGDNRTPEGHFLLQNIQDASKWGHDFGDGKGYIKDAYGPWFLRLQTGFRGIGIHGTHLPSSIGSRASEGCIRLENKNIADLRNRVMIGMPVIIGPEEGVQKLIANHVPSPKEPGAKGRTGNTRPATQPAAVSAAVASTNAPARHRGRQPQMMVENSDSVASTMHYEVLVEEFTTADGRKEYEMHYVLVPDRKVKN